jgi:hypothetical protein
MVNYQLGKIYRIVCNTTGLVYVGSTCEPTLAKRLQNHKRDYKRYLDGSNKYITSFKSLENNNYEIILIESYPCSSKDELHQRERHHIETMECVNKVIPGRTKKEYAVDNRHSIFENQKKYREENKDRTKANKKKWREENKDKVKEIHKKYYEENELKIKEYITQYNNENRDTIREYRKNYDKENRDKINERQRKNYANRKQNNQSASAPVVSL